MYTEVGIPVYSRCFSDICATSIGNPTLFSAFLASLNTFAKVDPENLPTEMELNGVPLKIDFNNEEGVNHVLFQDLELMFFYANVDDITIAAGFNSTIYDRTEVVPVFLELLKSVGVFLESYKGTNWGDIEVPKLMEFETDLLQQVIHPFFGKHHMKNHCPLGENCPYRIAVYEGSGNIFERIKSTVEHYRSMNILKKIYNLVLKKKYPLHIS